MWSSATWNAGNCHSEFEPSEKAAAFRGAYIEGISIAIGYATHKIHPDASVNELEKLADSMMYTEKDRYYREKGIDRSGQSTAFSALCSDMIKILVVNLTTEAYKIISMDNSEKEAEKGYSEHLSDWFKGVAESGIIHPDDKEEFLAKTNIDSM